MPEMLDAKPLLAGFLDEEDYFHMGKAISTAYAACHDHMNSHPVTSHFLTGILLRSWNISPFVDEALSNLDGWFYDFKPNAARNHFQTRHHKRGFVMTAHFMGAGKNTRGLARKAVCRSELAARNGDLFVEESTDLDLSLDCGYGHLIHAGFDKPRFASLVIPSRDQKKYVAGTPLELVPADAGEVEQIRDEMILKILGNENEKRKTAS